MNKSSRHIDRAAGWLLACLWSVPLVALLAGTAGWQYDAGIGFWLAALYCAPMWPLTEIGVGATMAVALYFVMLVVLTGAFAMRRRTGRLAVSAA